MQRSPHIELLVQAAGSYTARGPLPNLEFVISQDVAECLKALDSPTDIAALYSQWNLTSTTLAKLLNAGLLVEAAEELPGQGLISDFFPRFLNCPKGSAGEAQVTVFGAPSDFSSQTGSGARAAPAAIRVASSQLEYAVDADLSPRGWFDVAAGHHVLEGVTFVDAGDVVPQLGEPAERYGVRLSQLVRRCVALKSVPVVLGGDHSISYWTISGVLSASHEPIAVLHLDAHSDLAERGRYSVPTNGNFARCLIEENPGMPFVSVGLKGFQMMKQPSLNLNHVLMGASDALQKKAAGVLSNFPEGMPVYVSFDIDVLDPLVAPATNVPIPGGLSFDAVKEILSVIGKSRRVVGVDIVEINPDRDQYLRTASSGLHLLMTLLGAVFSSRDVEGSCLL